MRYRRFLIIVIVDKNNFFQLARRSKCVDLLVQRQRYGILQPPVLRLRQETRMSPQGAISEIMASHAKVPH